MNVILYMAISANGMIANSDGGASWITETENKSYGRICRDAGCLVVGRRTYQILVKLPEFAELQGVQVVAVSKNGFVTENPDHLVAHSPKEALEKLKDFATVIVAGGGMLNASFLEQQLIDEIYLDVEPIVLGKGIKLFADSDVEARLELIGTKQLSPNEIQLHYRVVK